MAEEVNSRKILSLLEVALSIQRTLSERYKSVFWVKAEMNKLNYYPHSGHCYPELVEKKEGRVIAQMRSSLWKDDFNRINHHFKKLLNEPLRDGITILFAATIQFDPAHGLTLRIIDIDPAFSLGELEREKIETITRLQEEGIYSNNRKLSLALLPKKVAVISVETSKGYADYMKVLDQNPYGYKIHNFLFPSVLQGEKAVNAIIAQLRKIRKLIKHFDAVAIIRGGGGDVCLSSFNSYLLAKEICTFPIPVFTGMGHSTNETVAEMVSFKNAITPTELADYLIQKFHDFAQPVLRASEILMQHARKILSDEKSQLRNVSKYFQSVTNNRLIRNHHQLNAFSSSIVHQLRFRLKSERLSIDRFHQTVFKSSTQTLDARSKDVDDELEAVREVVGVFLENQQSRLKLAEKHIEILDPVNILKRGFSITLDSDGRLVRADRLRSGDRIETILADGKIKSTVSDVEKTRD